MNWRRHARHRYFCFRLEVVPFLTTCREAQLGQAISSKHTLKRIACPSFHHKFSITTTDLRHYPTPTRQARAPTCKICRSVMSESADSERAREPEATGEDP